MLLSCKHIIHLSLFRFFGGFLGLKIDGSIQNALHVIFSYKKKASIKHIIFFEKFYFFDFIEKIGSP